MAPLSCKKHHKKGKKRIFQIPSLKQLNFFLQKLWVAPIFSAQYSEGRIARCKTGRFIPSETPLWLYAVWGSASWCYHLTHAHTKKQQTNKKMVKGGEACSKDTLESEINVNQINQCHQYYSLFLGGSRSQQQMCQDCLLIFLFQKATNQSGLHSCVTSLETCVYLCDQTSEERNIVWNITPPLKVLDLI